MPVSFLMFKDIYYNYHEKREEKRVYNSFSNKIKLFPLFKDICKYLAFILLQSITLLFLFSHSLIRFIHSVCDLDITVNQKNLFEQEKALLQRRSREPLHEMSRAVEGARFSVCILGQIHALDDYVVEELRPGVARYCVATCGGNRRRRGCEKDTRGRAEAYNCRRTELDSKAAATHKDTAGRYYNNVSRCLVDTSKDRTASLAEPQYLVGLYVVNDIYILIEEEKWLSHRLLLPFRMWFSIWGREHEGGIL